MPIMSLKKYDFDMYIIVYVSLYNKVVIHNIENKVVKKELCFAYHGDVAICFGRVYYSL